MVETKETQPGPCAGEPNTIAILRECKNKWERRCSLTPKEVEQIVKMGIKVLVQPSTNRCYTEDEFKAVGATIQEDVSAASVIFGVKEVPMENLLPSRTYFFFSHTIKAQDYNMPLLDTLLKQNIRLVDFECIREAPTGKGFPNRLVAFGRYAGIAGAFDFLRGVGEFLLQKQFQTSFLVGSSYMYQDFEQMKFALKMVSESISKGGIPKQLTPMVFAVTGTGRVAQGSVEVLEELPHVKVAPKDLRTWLADPANANNNKQIVISIFGTEDLVRPKQEGANFIKNEYREKPELYKGVFDEYLDVVSWLVNGIYWEAKFPRVITKEDLKKAQSQGKCKLMGVTDISADYEGSCEFTSRFTSIEEPYLLYNASTDSFKEKIGDYSDGDILFTSVDHLPAEMPKEASNHFGSKLMPFVVKVVQSDFALSFENQQDLPVEIYNGIITCHGKLTPNYAYIEKLREANEMIARRSDGGEMSSHGVQGFTINLTGHLFDTKVFNQCLDICEQNGVNFRVVEWSVGNSVNQDTSVTIQCLGFDEHALDDTHMKIIKVCEAENVKVKNATGPSYDKKILQQINEANTH